MAATRALRRSNYPEVTEMARSLGQLTIDVVANVGGFVAGMDKTERASDKWRRSVEKAAYQVGFAIGTAATAAVTALAGITVATIRQAEQLTRLAQVAGSNTTEFQRFAAGARSLGIEQDKLGDIFKDVNDKVGDFLLTGGGELADFFKNIAPRVGVTAEQFRMLSGPQALQLYVTSLEKAGLTQNQMTTSMEAIANDATMLLPLLRDGGRLMNEWGDRAQDFGAILDEDAITALRGMKTDTATATLALEGMKNTLVSELAPALSDFTGQLKSEESRKALQDTAKGIGAIAAQAAYASSEILGLAGTYTSWLRGQGFLPVNERSDVDDLQARQKALQNSLSRWTGVFGDDAKAKVQKEVEQIGKWIQEAQARGPKVTLLENGALMPESALKPKPVKPYTPPTETSSKVDDLARAYASASLEFERSITLFDQSADGSVKATELQRLNFDLLKGSLKGLAPELAENLRSQAAVLDSLHAQREAAQEAAKATEYLYGLQEELATARAALNVDVLGAGMGQQERERARALLGIEEDYQRKRADLQRQYQAGEITQALYDTETEGLSNALSERLELQRDYYRQVDALRGDSMAGMRDAWADYATGATDYNKQAYEATKGFLDTTTSEVGNSIAELVKGNESLFDSVKNLAVSMGETVINTLAQMAAQWLVYQGVQLLVGKTAASAGSAGLVGNAIATQAQASLAAFASTAAIPIIGPALAPAAATAAMAATAPMVALVTAGSLAGMAHDGIDAVPETGTWLLQKGERVTTAATSAKLDATLDRVGRETVGSVGAQINQNITINGDPSERDLQRLQSEIRKGGDAVYNRVRNDIASGTGIGKTLRTSNNVGRRLR
ncbi:phage tail tape measure protein [Stenotrophomonas maltophilia]|nr:phage tail tape measure protein [Stenotrophomonas maltophilia]